MKAMPLPMPPMVPTAMALGSPGMTEIEPSPRAIAAVPPMSDGRS